MEEQKEIIINEIITKEKKRKSYKKVSKEEKEINLKKKLTCSCCNVVWENIYRLKCHLKGEGDKVKKETDKINRLTCACCNKFWNDKNKLKRHLNTKKITKEKRIIRCDKKDYICGTCDTIYINNWHLKRHLYICNKRKLKEKDTK